MGHRQNPTRGRGAETTRIEDAHGHVFGSCDKLPGIVQNKYELTGMGFSVRAAGRHDRDNAMFACVHREPYSVVAGRGPPREPRHLDALAIHIGALDVGRTDRLGFAAPTSGNGC